MKFLNLIVVLLSLTFISPTYAADTKQKPTTEMMEKVELLNINTATVEQLMQLPGIGKLKAQAIVDYRNEFGMFKSITELTNVKGIGEKLLAKLEDKVVI